MCTYLLRFDLKAGPSDIMKVTFEGIENSGLGYGIGTSYAGAIGAKISEPDGKVIRVAYPYNLYLIMFNTNRLGKFTISYEYLDQDPDTA